ncbi:DNA double-strand break repair nuclease NurA [Argonema antarcticum]|uniref:DNA double-strand break repair nuclease NurA n=1 Tax=Argonema antarcticum TaxID=2942763 RepID=UPI00201186A6|nr:DNA double-strand break repair nuclease NurA [Argonema antarcticum]MCL1471681.1 DNA double-strand break repair nuclease NurA [Argonema antarcticum A004/B2]
MRNNQNDSYANLPDELLEDILEDAPKIADKIKPLFEKLQRQRKILHQTLDDNNLICRFGDLENPPIPSIAAVDGGQAIEKSIGADTLIAVGVGVEGLVREDKRKWGSVQYKNWQDVLPHSSESNPKVTRGAMTALELLVISQTPHDVVIADGSHQTPVIGINSLTSMSTLDEPHLQQVTWDIINEFEVIDSLKKTMTNPNVVYMVKYDSSQDIGLSVLKNFNLTLDDKTIMTLILEPDEFTKPLAVGQTPKTKQVWSDLYISVSNKFDFHGKRESIKEELNKALALPKNQKVYFTYYKPYKWSPAYRIEMKESCATTEIELAKVLKGVKEQVVTTEIKEPYPQYLADMMAKSISGGLEALRAVVQYQFSDNPDFLQLLTQSYRT